MVMASVKEITLKILANMGDNGQEMAFALSNIDSPFFMINYLANNIPFEAKQKQQLLEERNLRQRAFMLYSMLRQEEQLVELKADIQSRTREDLTQQQREHFLQQQIRTIQEELGTTDEDLNELDARAAKKKWSSAGSWRRPWGASSASQDPWWKTGSETSCTRSACPDTRCGRSSSSPAAFPGRSSLPPA